MTRYLARVLRALSAACARCADRIDPPAPPPREPGPGDQMTFAKKLCDEIELRRALHDSLHRFSPKEPPAQC
jgi:hypothetical protein